MIQENTRTVRFSDLDIPVNQFGWDDSHLASIASQVSQMIKNHNLENPGQMLDKQTEEIMEQIREGRSYVIVEYDMQEDSLEVIYFGKVEPLISPQLADRLGFMVAEAGTAIANPRARGKGLGKEGAQKRHELALALWGPQTLLISTIKEDNTAGALKEVMQPVEWSYPHIAGLTCVCPTSELNDHEACVYRREANGTEPSLVDITNRDVKLGTINCTLMVSDFNLLQRIESTFSEESGVQMNFVAKEHIIQAAELLTNLEESLSNE